MDVKIALLVAVIVSACKSRAGEHAASSEDTLKQSLIASFDRTVDEFNLPAIKPSEILAALDEQKKKKFIAMITDKLIPLEIDPAQLKPLITFDLSKIDYFPYVHLKNIGLLQDLAFKIPPKKKLPGSPMFPLDQAIYRLKEKGCQQSLDPKHERKFKDLPIYRSIYPLSEKIDPCFHENNLVLAKILNVLSENQMPQTQEKSSLTLEVETADGEKYNAKVSQFADLIALLQKAGYRAEVFSTRFIVDFLGYTFRDAKGQHRPIRLPTWFGATLDGTDVPIAGEHSELVLMLHRGQGTRLGQVRYYLGVPSSDYPAVVSFWRPDSEKKAIWHGIKRKVHSVHSGEQLADMRVWLESVARSMYAFQSAQNVYQLPFASYGFFVCSDSLTLALAGYQHTQNIPGRLTLSFPLIRAGVVHYGEGLEISFSGTISDLAKVPRTFLDTHYPTDTGENPDLRTRIRQAYPPEDRSRFIPDFKEDMLKTLETKIWPPLP